MKVIKLELTDTEAQYLQSEMDCILRQYHQTYNGRRFENDDMGNAFNKVYKALSGKDHGAWTYVQDFIKKIKRDAAEENPK